MLGFPQRPSTKQRFELSSRRRPLRFDGVDLGIVGDALDVSAPARIEDEEPPRLTYAGDSDLAPHRLLALAYLLWRPHTQRLNWHH
jgi:hypothetical protein